jgi:hypothetical protein
LAGESESCHPKKYRQTLKRSEIVGWLEPENVETRLAVLASIDISARMNALMDFEHVRFAECYVRINDVRVEGFEPRPVALGNASVYAGSDETESAAPAVIAVSKYSIENQIGMIAVLNEKCYSERSGPRRR